MHKLEVSLHYEIEHLQVDKIIKLLNNKALENNK